MDDDDDLRARVARRIASEQARVPTSLLGRRARLALGLTKAGASSIGRVFRRRDSSADIEPEMEVAASLGELKGLATKLGQFAGYVDVGLPRGLRAALAALQTTAQPVDVRRIRRVLEADLGDRGAELVATLDATPLASGSIGQVHRARLPDGTAVVVKVLHPDVHEAIDRDLAPALFASRISAQLHALVVDVRARLLEECDYALEAEHQARFGAVFHDHPTILVPAVHAAYGSRRVLTTSFVEGIGWEELLASAPSAELRSRVGEAIFDFYVAPLFLHGVYNADPHPGNYRITPDGRVAFVDFGSVRAFDAGVVGRLAALMRAIMNDDAGAMSRTLAELGVPAMSAGDRDAVTWLVRTFTRPFVRDEVLAFEIGEGIKARDVARRLWKARRVAASGEIVFLLRTLVGVASVLERLEARSNWRRRLEPVVVHAEERARVDDASVMPNVVAIAPQRKDPPPTFDVVLVHPGPRPIALMRELRGLLAMELRELEWLVEAVPRTLLGDLTEAEAELLRVRLEGVGARVEVRRIAPAG